MLFFLLSCLGSQKDSPPKTAQNIVTEDPIAENSKPSKQETAIEKPSLKKIVVSHKLPEELKRNWPPEAWSYAKAYTYNFVPYGPHGKTNYIYFDDEWSDDIEQSIDITKEEANYAIQLVHHTAGDVEASSCIFPRHGIVYFDESDKPVASINYCFSCEGVLVWPSYFETMEEEKQKYELTLPIEDPDSYPEPTVIEIYYELQPNWKSLFLDVLALPNPSFR